MTYVKPFIQSFSKDDVCKYIAVSATCQTAVCPAGTTFTCSVGTNFTSAIIPEKA